MLWLIPVLFLVGTVAGFVDAIAGGGGLLTLPAIMLAGVPADLALGTNKGQGVFGTAMSLRRFFASPLLDRRRAGQSFLPALVGSAAGALIVAWMPRDYLRPIVMSLLAAVALFMVFYRPITTDRPPLRRSALLAAAVAFLLAGYDGFFGPGTGTFLIVAYVLLWHDSPHAASANAKVVNFASNLSAAAMFGSMGMIVWKIALPMAAGQAIGGWLGAHVTVVVGKSLVRYVVILVSIALIAKLAWDLLYG